MIAPRNITAKLSGTKWKLVVIRKWMSKIENAAMGNSKIEKS